MYVCLSSHKNQANLVTSAGVKALVHVSVWGFTWLPMGGPNGLFHAAFMESGSPIPIGDIIHGQGYYNFVVSLGHATVSARGSFRRFPDCPK